MNVEDAVEVKPVLITWDAAFHSSSDLLVEVVSTTEETEIVGVDTKVVFCTILVLDNTFEFVGVGAKVVFCTILVLDNNVETRSEIVSETNPDDVDFGKSDSTELEYFADEIVEL